MRQYKRLRIEGAAYFFTLVTHRRQKLFGQESAVGLLEAAIAKVQMRHPFAVEAQVVLPDHVHALWQLPADDADYSTRWRLIKKTFTKAWVKRNGETDRSQSRKAKGERAIWQRRFWEHLIRDDRDYQTRLDYIHLNPVHHGLAAAPLGWPHSTFMRWVERGAYDRHWGSDRKPELPVWAKDFE